MTRAGAALHSSLLKRALILRSANATDPLRSQFAQSAWEPSLVTAYWSRPGDLSVSLDSDDRQLAMAACADLTEVIQVRTSTGPGNVTYTIHYSDGTWFDDTPVCDAWPLTTDANGNYWHQYSCTGALLNEDWDGQDENYAKVTVFPSGTRSHWVRSNTVKGYY